MFFDDGVAVEIFEDCFFFCEDHISPMGVLLRIGGRSRIKVEDAAGKLFTGDDVSVAGQKDIAFLKDPGLLRDAVNDLIIYGSADRSGERRRLPRESTA